MGQKVVFVILHYCAVEMTIKAVERIRDLIIDENYEILITDNGSPDGSGEILKTRYLNIDRIHFIQSGSNLGFARGNNMGYAYARERLKADFIVVMNNDVLIQQKDMPEKIFELYESKGFHVLGPDILNPNGVHQNPHRVKNLNLKDVNRIIRNRTIILWYLKLKRCLNLEDKIQIVEKWDLRRGKKERAGINCIQEQEGVVLQGSCLIFSSAFIRQEKEAFFPETFMWMEEEILTYLCGQKGYKLLFSPAIKVIHEEGISTNLSEIKIDVYDNFSNNLKKSAIVMKKLLKGK